MFTRFFWHSLVIRRLHLAVLQGSISLWLCLFSPVLWRTRTSWQMPVSSSTSQSSSSSLRTLTARSMRLGSQDCLSIIMYEFIYGRNRLDKSFLLSAFQDDVMLVNDAYKVLSAIIATRVGREAFIASRGMTVLSLLNIRQGFQVK